MDAYVLGEELGQGAFGIVYLVTRKLDRRQFEAKRICLYFLAPEEKQKAFAEAKNLATMKHPNICTFEDSFIESVNGRAYMYIIMEYCAGGSLQSRIKDQHGEPFDIDLIQQWLHSICLVLAHVHRRRGIHRDLKPENIFLTVEGVVKVGDFGIAVVATTTMAAGKTNIGTLHYMAPEVLDSNEEEERTYDYRCDLWSLGVVLYELVTLKRPFQANTPIALGRKICSGKYDPISESTPRELRDLVKELLNLDPSERPDCTEILSRDFLKQRQQSTSREHSRGAERQMRDLRISTPEPPPAPAPAPAPPAPQPAPPAPPAERKTAKKTFTPAERKLVEEYERGTESSWGSALHKSSAYGKTDVVTLLIQNGADVNYKDNRGRTPLHLASQQGKAEAAEAAEAPMKADANVNAKPEKHVSRFSLAAMYGGMAAHHHATSSWGES